MYFKGLPLKSGKPLGMRSVCSSLFFLPPEFWVFTWIVITIIYYIHTCKWYLIVIL